MAKAPGSYLGSCGLLSLRVGSEGKGRHRSKDTHRRLRLLAAALLLALLVFAQGTPRVTRVEPSSGKVNENVTLTGDNLGKGSVSAVILSDDKIDHYATVVEQTEEKMSSPKPSPNLLGGSAI